MTAAEKKLYHYKWDRFQKRYERIYTVKFKAALKTQIRQFVSLGYITSTPIYEVLVDLYTTVGPLWAHKSKLLIRNATAGLKYGHRRFEYKGDIPDIDILLKDRMPMGFSQRIVDLMRQYYGIDLLNDAEGITAYTREVIVRVLSDAALSGASINEQVRALEANSELGAMRARRIARTETVTAANGAAVIQAKESGIDKNKIWLSVDDKRTRHSHRIVDDAKVHIDQPFNVNGTLMMQPGVRKQPNGLEVPAKEVVNCRCTVVFEVIE